MTEKLFSGADLFGMEAPTKRTNSKPEAAALLTRGGVAGSAWGLCHSLEIWMLDTAPNLMRRIKPLLKRNQR